MTTYLLDTNVVSEPLRPRPSLHVLERLDANSGRLALPAVVWHELVFGLERLPASRRRDALAAYLFQTVGPSLPIVPYGEAEARWHAAARALLERRGTTLPVVDGQIAATAAVNGLVLVTRNVTDFRAYEGLRVENWFEPG